MDNRYVKIRIRSTGQVTDMVPDVARAMLSSGMAERVAETSAPETAMLAQPSRQAVASAQTPDAKPFFQRRKRA
jgi:hypothetical protein